MDQNTNNRPTESPQTSETAPPQSPQPIPSDKKSTNVLSIVSLVLAFFLPVVALVLAIIALVQIKKHSQKGKGLAIAGLVISTVWTLLFVGLVINGIQTTSYTNVDNPVEAATQIYQDQEKFLQTQLPDTNLKAVSTQSNNSISKIVSCTDPLPTCGVTLKTDSGYYIGVPADQNNITWTLNSDNGTIGAEFSAATKTTEEVIDNYMQKKGFVVDASSGHDKAEDEIQVVTYKKDDQICQTKSLSRSIEYQYLAFGCVTNAEFEKAASEQEPWAKLGSDFLAANGTPGDTRAALYEVKIDEEQKTATIVSYHPYVLDSAQRNGYAYKDGDSWKIALLTSSPNPLCSDYATGTPASLLDGCKKTYEEYN